MSIFQMSIQGGILIIAIIIIRTIALNKLPKKTFLALWGITIIRLLVPFAIPSQISIYTLIGKIVNWASFGTYTPSTEISFPLDLSGIETVGNTPENVFTVKPLMLVWLIGVVVAVVSLFLMYWKSQSELRFAILIKNNSFLDKWLAEHKLKRPITILQSDRITSPITVGYLRPRIIIPTTMDIEDTKLLQYVLTHEYYHIRRFDAVSKLVVAFTLCLHWFNPMIWIMVTLINRDLEITCDEMVVRHFGDNSKTAYAYSLITMAEQKNKFRPLNTGFSKNVAEERITAIMKIKKMSLMKICLSVLLIAVLGIGFSTTAMAAINSELTVENLAAYDARSYEEAKKEWEQFGITYDAVTERVYYNGELVRFFVDNRSADTNRFDGTVYDMDDGSYHFITRRDETGKLIAMDEITTEEAAQIASWRK